MRDYEELVKALRLCASNDPCGNCLLFDDRIAGDDHCDEALMRKAADAIEKLLTVLCNWCGVCPKDKRNPNDCEIIESCMPEPPKEENDGETDTE